MKSPIININGQTTFFLLIRSHEKCFAINLMLVTTGQVSVGKEVAGTVAGVRGSLIKLHSSGPPKMLFGTKTKKYLGERYLFLLGTSCKQFKTFKSSNNGVQVGPLIHGSSICSLNYLRMWWGPYALLSPLTFFKILKFISASCLVLDLVLSVIWVAYIMLSVKNNLECLKHRV